MYFAKYNMGGGFTKLNFCSGTRERNIVLDTQNKCLSGCEDEEDELSVCKGHDDDELQAGLRIDAIASRD